MTDENSIVEVPGATPEQNKKIDKCVASLKADPKFKPLGGRDKESAAFAVCVAQVMGKEGLEAGVVEKEQEPEKNENEEKSDEKPKPKHKLDEDGHIIIAESVPIIFTGLIEVQE